MAAPKDNQYAKGNKGGKGGRSKYKPEYVEIATRLCERVSLKPRSLWC